jgi:hypothetical protein
MSLGLDHQADFDSFSPPSSGGRHMLAQALFLASVVLFVASFAMPAADFGGGFLAPGRVPGWFVAWYVSRHIFIGYVSVEAALYGVVFLPNLLACFLAFVWVWGAADAMPRLLGSIAAVSAGCAALPLVLFAGEEDSEGLLVGYYTWLASQALLFTSFALRFRRTRPARDADDAPN